MNLKTINVTDEELRVMMESGLILRESGRLDEAEEVFTGVRELAPESDVPLVALSSIAVRRGNIKEAFRLSEKALEQQPKSLFARVNHAEILLYSKKREEAELELKEIIKDNPDSPHSRTAQSLLDVAQLMSDEKEFETQRN